MAHAARLPTFRRRKGSNVNEHRHMAPATEYTSSTSGFVQNWLSQTQIAQLAPEATSSSRKRHQPHKFALPVGPHSHPKDSGRDQHIKIDKEYRQHAKGRGHRSPGNSLLEERQSPGLFVPVSPYKRRKRHKTKEDRYDIDKTRSKRDADTLERPKRGKEKKDSGHKSRRTGHKPGEELMHNFSSAKVAEERLTIRPDSKLGLFRNGRASSPAHRRGVPDLAFSEMKFLRRPPLDIDIRRPMSSGRNRKEKCHENDDISAYFRHDGRPIDPEHDTDIPYSLVEKYSWPRTELEEGIRPSSRSLHHTPRHGQRDTSTSVRSSARRKSVPKTTDRKKPIDTQVWRETHRGEFATQSESLPSWSVSGHQLSQRGCRSAYRTVPTRDRSPATCDTPRSVKDALLATRVLNYRLDLHDTKARSITVPVESLKEVSHDGHDMRDSEDGEVEREANLKLAVEDYKKLISNASTTNDAHSIAEKEPKTSSLVPPSARIMPPHINTLAETTGPSPSATINTKDSADVLRDKLTGHATQNSVPERSARSPYSRSLQAREAYVYARAVPLMPSVEAFAEVDNHQQRETELLGEFTVLCAEQVSHSDAPQRPASAPTLRYASQSSAKGIAPAVDAHMHEKLEYAYHDMSNIGVLPADQNRPAYTPDPYTPVYSVEQTCPTKLHDTTYGRAYQPPTYQRPLGVQPMYNDMCHHIEQNDGKSELYDNQSGAQLFHQGYNHSSSPTRQPLFPDDVSFSKQTEFHPQHLNVWRAGNEDGRLDRGYMPGISFVHTLGEIATSRPYTETYSQRTDQVRPPVHHDYQPLFFDEASVHFNDITRVNDLDGAQQDLLNFWK